MSIKYCSYCGKTLTKSNTNDCFTEAYICGSGHLSYTLLKDEGQNLASKKDIRNIKSGKSDFKEIIIEWLSNPKLRKLIQDQFAELLQTLIDKLEGVPFNEVISGYFKCPTCGDELKAIPTGDCWVQTSQCSNNHKWYCRGGMWQESPIPKYQLAITEDFFNSLLKNYIYNDRLGSEFPIEIIEAVKELDKKYDV